MKTKRQLFAISLMLILCCSMAIGSSIAWFSEGVESPESAIQIGTLEIGLYWSEDLNQWHNAAETPLFGSEPWEPGHTQVRYIKVVNSGTLAFRYDLQLAAAAQLGELAHVFDVYWDKAPASAFASLEALTAGAECVGSLEDVANVPLEDNVLLPEGKSYGSYTAGSEIFVLALHMQEQAGNEYQDLIAGGITLKARAGQFTYEDDSFGNDYDSETTGTTVVTVDRPLVAGVTEALPESAIGTSTGVSFEGSPYAYTDTTLFAGKRITKLGIPVKTVKALDENQTFTLSVVKIGDGAYEYVNQYTLKLPLDQLGTSTTVNKWVYVDLDITLAADETLAFGMPTDTVEWGYLLQNLAAYHFRAANGAVHSLAILFDVYTEQTLEFKETGSGLAAVWEEPAIPAVLRDFPESAISGGNDVEFQDPPYAYINADLFAGSRITRIGIPVKTVKALDENQTFTLSVVKAGSGAYQYVNQYTLKLPLDQLGSSTTVNKWVYVDVSDLDIQLADDETLAFGGTDDTVTWAWKRNYSNTAYKFRNVNDQYSCGIFFDIYTEKTLTYAEYQEQLRQEQERLEAEQEKLRQEALLKQALSGKKISILGDSISTFGGYSNNTSYNSTIGGNAVYYNGSNYITDVNETWWMQTINRTGMQLLVNNSWSGDRVTERGVSRALELDNNEDVAPELIAVYLGINDFRTKVTAEAFATAYESMIAGMLEKYPDAEVFLFTLVYTTNVNSGVNPDDVVNFNAAIEAVAQKYDLPVVDLYNDSGINKQTMAANMGDGNLHPNYAGMDKITECFLQALIDAYVTE